jgi:hypothetical protein
MTVNSTRAILERLAYACFVALFVTSLGLTGTGILASLHGGDLRLAIFGFAGLALSLALRPLGYRHLHFGKWEDSLEFVDGGRTFELDPLLSERVQAFAGMLDQLETLQQSIAAGDADVWEVQRLRHAAAAMLAAEPALREVFAAELAAHPELA